MNETTPAHEHNEPPTDNETLDDSPQALQNEFVWSALDALSSHIAVLNDTGHIVAVNQAWRNLAPARLSLLPNVIEGVDYLRICDIAEGESAEIAHAFGQGIREVLAGRRDRYEAEYSCQWADKKRWFVGRVTRFPDGATPRVLVVHEDITEEKFSKNELWESMQKFRTAFDHIGVGACVLNRNLEIIQVNRQMREWLGEKLRAGKPKCMEIFHRSPPEIPCENCPILTAMEDGQTHEAVMPVTLSGQDGYYRMVASPIRDAEGNTIGVVLLSEDVTEKQRQQRALRESERLLNFAIEQMPVPVIIAEAPDVKITRMNGPARELLVRKTDDVGTISLEEQREYWPTFYPDGTPYRVEDLPLTQAIQQGRITAGREIIIRREDGDHWISASAVPLRNDAGEIIAGIIVFPEITERKNAEQQLHESLYFLQELLDSIPNPVFYKDTKGRFLGCNKAFEQLVGRPRTEVIGQTVFDIFPESFAQVSKSHETKALQTKSAQQYETSIESRDGCRRDIIINKAPFFKPNGDLAGLVGVMLDITERKQAEARQEESERMFRLIAETIDDIFWMSTLDVNELLYVSPTYEKIWGLPLADALNHPGEFLKSVHSEDRERLERIYAEKHAKGKAYTCEYRILRPDGEVRHILERGYPVEGEQGQCQYMIGVSSDVTERVTLQEQLRHAQKMEAIGQLAGGIAHDFRNQLMVIKGFSEMILRREQLSDDVHSHLDQIIRATNRSISLTGQLLAFSRRDILKPEVVSCLEVLSDLKKSLSRILGEDISLRMIQGSEDYLIWVDQGQFEQAIINLAINARDAMPEGGTLTIQTDLVNFPGDRDASSVTLSPGCYVRLSITDTGIGMDTQTVERIFDPFFTLKSIGEGTGLGLAMVYGFAKQSGGEIHVSSTPGKGTTFYLFFPQAEVPEEADLEEEGVPGLPKGRGTILLVEDEASVRSLASDCLQECGYTIIEADRAKEALRYAKQQNFIDLLVTDIVMPEMNGVELGEKIRKIHPESRILYITGYAEDELTRRGLALSHSTILVKPIGAEQLAQTVHEILNLPRKS